MRLTLADWSIVALYFLFNVAVGLYYKRRAGRDTAEFFLSGRNVPWWLAGTSMVATTFAADTPLAMTGLVARNGVAGYWVWGDLLGSGVLTGVFSAPPWRPARWVTDLFQFVIKMGLVIALAVFAVHAVGGIDAMREKLALLPGHGSVLSFVPDVGSAWMPLITFFVYIGVNWWATWYPGAEPGGGGYIAQRMLSAKDEKHSVRASQVATVLLTVVSAIATFYMSSIAGAWKLLIVTGAGTGTVLLLRWYWWRINAWSEVSAMIAAFAVSVLLQTVAGLDSDRPLDFAWIMLITVAITTGVWLAVTFLTRPEPEGTLVAFYRRTRPSRAGWGPVAALAPDVRASADGLANLLDRAAGCLLIYGVLFGVGKLLLHETLPGVVLLGLGAIAGAVIYRDLSRRGWESVVQ